MQSKPRAIEAGARCESQSHEPALGTVFGLFLAVSDLAAHTTLTTSDFAAAFAGPFVAHWSGTPASLLARGVISSRLLRVRILESGNSSKHQNCLQRCEHQSARAKSRIRNIHAAEFDVIVRNPRESDFAEPNYAYRLKIRRFGRNSTLGSSGKIGRAHFAWPKLCKLALVEPGASTLISFAHQSANM